MKRLTASVFLIAAVFATWAEADAPNGTPATTSTTTTVPATTTVPTTVAPTTSTSTTTTTSTLPPTLIVDKRCVNWANTALSVGWSESDLDTLLYVLYKESRCNHDSHNPSDPATGSYGLAQINGYWCVPNKYNPTGWLQARGVLNTCTDLYDPAINLQAALLIYQRSGWGPWGL